MVDNKHRKRWNVLILALILTLVTGSVVMVLNYYSVQTTETSFDDKTIRFSWWGNDDRHAYTLNGIEKFEEKNPEIRVNAEYSIWAGFEHRNRVYMLSGTEPDVMQINYNWIQQYSRDGSGYYDLHQLTDVLDLTGYSDADLAYGTSNGVLNAVPIAYNAVVFYYNKDILDHYGLETPSTWEDLFQAASVMKEDKIYPLSLSDKHLFLMIVAYYEQTTGLTIFDQDGTYIGGQSAAQSLLSFYKQLTDAGVIPLESEADDANFTSGNIAGIGMWASDAENNCSALADKGVNVVLSAAPTTGEGAKRSGWYVKPATMYAIGSHTQDPENAGRLLNFLINDEDMILLQGTEKGIPVSSRSREILKNKNMLTGFDAEAGLYVLRNRSKMNAMNPSLENSDVITAFTNAANKYLYNQENLFIASSEMAENMLEATQ